MSLSLSVFSVLANDWLKVSVVGTTKTLTRNIEAHLGTLPNSDLQRRAFIFNSKENIEAAMHALGYYHSKIDQQLKKSSKKPWQLTFKVTAGEPTRIQWVDIQLSGEILTDDKINQWLTNIQVKPGDILNHGRYEQLKSQLLTLALSRGYFDGKYITHSITINRDFNSAKIHLYYDSGKRYRIGSVNFSGHSLEKGFLDKLIPFKPQSTYSTAKLSVLNGELIDTGYFSTIRVAPQLNKINDNLIPIKVDLIPRPRHSIELGLGVDIGNSTNKQIEPRVRITWRTPQINRFGHSQQTSLEWSDRPKFLTTYTIPLSHPLNDQFKFRLGLLRNKYGVEQVYDSKEQSYVNTGELESITRMFGIIRQKRFKGNWLYTYSLNGVKEKYNQSDTNYDPTFFVFGSSLSKTHRGDNSLDPKSGFFQYYNIEYADPSLGSEIRLIRLQGKFKWIRTFFEKHRLVSRLDLAANIADKKDLALIPPSMRYFAGGDQSIRGYSYQELGPFINYVDENGQQARVVVGGRYLMVGSFEYQYYITPTWRVATFVDGGNAFDISQFDPALSVGGGIHWISPIGPIRLDLGFGLKENDTVDRSWRIHINMGAEI